MRFAVHSAASLVRYQYLDPSPDIVLLKHIDQFRERRRNINALLILDP